MYIYIYNVVKIGGNNNYKNLPERKGKIPSSRLNQGNYPVISIYTDLYGPSRPSLKSNFSHMGQPPKSLIFMGKLNYTTILSPHLKIPWSLSRSRVCYCLFLFTILIPPSLYLEGTPQANFSHTSQRHKIQFKFLWANHTLWSRPIHPKNHPISPIPASTTRSNFNFC